MEIDQLIEMQKQKLSKEIDTFISTLEIRQ